MAEQADLDFTYTTIDKIFRLSMGDTGDFSGAMYNGNFDLTLEEAQEAKHKYIVENLNITQDSRVLDLGCGWGPFLYYLKNNIGAEGVGITLSRGQAAACRENGLNVHIRDCRKIKPGDFGTFDALVSVGAFEHFCSVDDFLQGRQEEVYSNFFKMAHELLPVGGRFYLQTMTFGKNMIDFDRININADKDSDEYMLALMMKQFPGSWLPYGAEMVQKCAEPYFKPISINSGRLDYIETIGQWRKRFRKMNLKKYFMYVSLFPNIFTNKEFRHRVAVFNVSPNRVCFQRELMDHFRFVFEKKG